jgi:adenosylcobinamide-phosphate synthase
MISILHIWIALILDVVIGDPRWLPHPVKIIGGLALRLEAPMRRRFASERTAGVVTAAAVIGLTAAITSAGLWMADRISPWLGHVAAVAVLYACFAARDLDRHGRAVQAALAREDLSLARRRVAMIVGRDTDRLDETDVVRAAVESVAENTVDGVVAPLFFAFLGGPVAAMAYKAASTLDSTFGYRNERYLRFGWASARIDDAANYLPARIGVALMALAARTLGENPRGGLQSSRRDGPRHASPNAGLAEAAMAGALGVQLGGPVHRHGRLEEMPRLGEPVEPLAAGHIIRACRMMMATTMAGAMVFTMTRIMFWAML